jgi:hypothetical protein
LLTIEQPERVAALLLAWLAGLRVTEGFLGRMN